MRSRSCLQRPIETEILIALWIAGLAGCINEPSSPSLVHVVCAGRYGEARIHLVRHQENDRRSRQYLLDRMRLGLVTLADGFPQAGRGTFEEIFETLRTQGINADKTVASVVLNEDIKFWKGEPFEQAMAFHYVGLHHGIQGAWDNVRAAADNSLFHLRDFGKAADGQSFDNETLVYRAVQEKDFSLKKYTARTSSFELGYLMSAIANQQLLRDVEANEHYSMALQSNPRIAPLVETLKRSTYNTVFVVDYGLGPRKIGVGPDQAVAKFVPRTPSDKSSLLVTMPNETKRYGQVCDLNKMARDHVWNNLEDARLAKSHIGSLLIAGGALLASKGISKSDSDLGVAGAGILAAGIFAKSGAHVDIRYCDIMPQRVYVVPVHIRSPRDRIVLEVEGDVSSRMVLTGLGPPQGQIAQLRYVRLVYCNDQPPAWAVSGEIYYTNPHTDQTVLTNDSALPYILGGHCVRKPTEATLAAYHQAGNLRNDILARLPDFYRAEHIRRNDDDAGAQPNLHVLEGGTSLAAPLPGTAGFARIFGHRHPSYRPKSELVQRVMSKQN